MLYLYQSNRLETLLELLSAVVTSSPLTSPFLSEEVVVQSKGMGRWIGFELAKRHGVCANMQFPLPASFMWKLLTTALGDLPRRSVFSPEVLCWRVLDWLSDPANLAVAPRLATFIARGDVLRRYQLAHRIADIFDQYLVYRADWVAAWEQGRLLGLGEDEGWQAKLWRDMVSGNEASHRARLMERLMAALQEPAIKQRLPQRLTLFGMTSLPPVYLQVFEQLAEQIDVCFFALNPCAESWGDVGQQAGVMAESSDLYLDVGNPLLARLGRQGRDFFDQLSAMPTLNDLFQPNHESMDSLLGHLQHDVLTLTWRDEANKLPIPALDRSVQVHVCHSAMREVEVLHDQLLALLRDTPDLQPADIAVLTPDIEQYSPYIEAVFAARDGVPYLPYAIADRGMRSESPLLELWLGLLNLPQSRFTLDEVLGWLEIPAIQRKFGIEEVELPTLHDWLQATRVRWARDGAHKASLDLPAIDQNTWRAGLDRLILGAALPTAVAGGGVPLWRQTLPFDDLEGSRAELAARLAYLLETVFDWADRLAQPATLSDWADRLGKLLDALFTPSQEEEPIVLRIREALQLLRELASDAAFGQAVPMPVVQNWLTQQFDGTAGSSGFLTGSVTFCTMVPMRSLPFKVIALLGLSDGAFPRTQPALGFDLIARHARRGDRSRRADDRWLFLETLVSARQVLYLSYMGRDQRDNSELPPSVLVADLLDTIGVGFHRLEDASLAPDEQAARIRQQVVVEHPLQPFNASYFQPASTVQSFNQRWCEAAQHAGQGEQATRPLFIAPLAPADAEWRTLELSELSAFFSNTARYLLRQRLKLKLSEPDDRLETSEPFALDWRSKQAIRKLALDWQQKQQPETGRLLATASGLLPAGEYGLHLQQQESQTMQGLAHKLAPWQGLPTIDPPLLRLSRDGLTLTGWLHGVTPAGIVQHSTDVIKARDRFQLWLQHLALCASAPAGVALESRLIGLDGTLHLPPVEDADALLGELLTYYWQGLHTPLPFFIKSSYAYAEAIHREQPAERALINARKEWDAPETRFNLHFGESENIWYQAAWRATDPLDEHFAHLAVQLYSPLLAVMNETKHA
ncbi:exodeoxyribonuclease V gamma subunit [Chitinivorax tropicus]|uniref:RecBCD enzyme subunit RecC n=1 Tax=Chitinivorax tropicus TaxID=714531 RepID=A0A840MT13_9PROT|nr:exodeoxyribonuclease V subunit gamma [Chitinivorax tropicus]MBB5019413.1 exodeoxyribonuclease V gamma subunit [Chitinivorax tropicus]